MAFGTSNNFNSSNQNGGDQKKTNFPIGTMWGVDGRLYIDMWMADRGPKTILTIKQVAGKDPSTGANMLEQRKSGDLPRFFMGPAQLYAFIEIASKNEPGQTSIQLTGGKNGESKLTVVGSGDSIKLSIVEPNKGERTITFNAISAGGANVHGHFKTLIKYLEICYKKAITAKLDPEEFGMVVGSNNEDNEDLPI